MWYPKSYWLSRYDPDTKYCCLHPGFLFVYMALDGSIALRWLQALIPCLLGCAALSVCTLTCNNHNLITVYPGCFWGIPWHTPVIC